MENFIKYKITENESQVIKGGNPLAWFVAGIIIGSWDEMTKGFYDGAASKR